MVEHAVASTETIPLIGGMFVSIRNASATVDSVCIHVPPVGLPCVCIDLPAGETALYGNFPLDYYAGTITITFPNISNLYIDTAVESDFILTGVAEPAITLGY